MVPSIQEEDFKLKEPNQQNQKDKDKSEEYFVGLAETGEFEHYVPSEVFYSKTSKKKEKVIIEEDCLEYKPSKYEIILGLIMRLCGRFRRDEIEFLETETNGPVLWGDSDGFEGKYRSISQVQNMLKVWRKGKIDGLSREEIDKLCDISQAMKTSPNSVNTPEMGFEKVNINMSDDELCQLPVVSGCVLNSQNSFSGVTCTIDSGASSSACGKGFMENVGLTIKDLIPCPHIQVNTANAPCTPLGIMHLKIYLKWKEGKFFYINCEILVLSSPLNRLLIGIKDLYKANFSLDKDQITLDCFSNLHVKKRRIFKTSIREGGISCRLDKNEQVNTLSTFEVDSVYHLGMLSKRWDLVCRKKGRGKTLRYPVKQITNEKTEVSMNGETLKDVKFVGKAKIDPNTTTWGNDTTFTLEERQEDKGIDNGGTDESVIEDVTAAVEDYNILLSEHQHSDQKSFSQAHEEMAAVGNVESELLDKMSLFPDNAPEDDPEFFIPDLSSLTEEWQIQFKKLFSSYKTNFSKDKWDICISNLPEVTLHSKPGKVACAPVRRYSEDELCIIDDYLMELERKKLIRKLHPDEFSAWNHNIHLVVRQTGGAKKFCNSKADKMSNTDRLKLLRESARAVADVTKMNDLLLSQGQVYLPLVHEILPYMGGKLASLTDVRSGFSTIRMDYDSALKTAFTHRNVRYLHNVMIQGARTSPLLYSLRMELVFNVDSFNKFLAKYAPESKLVYSRCVIRYLDDILLISDTVEEMFLLWQYVMEQLDTYKIKITKKKTVVMKERFTFLGWDFMPSQNIYSLESQRRSAISQWEFKPERQYIVSRLACLNWNSSLIFGFKFISQLLALLVLSKTMKIKRCHVREWSILIFASSLVLDIFIPQLDQNFYISTDSSYSACGSLVFQYFPEGKYSNPEGIEWSKEDDGKNIIKNKEGEKVVLSRLEVVSMFSKRWAKQDIGKSIVYKESLALLCALKEFEMLIRSCTKSVILFTDAICLSFIHRLKSINSRIYSIALIISSFENLTIRFSKGGFLNFASDLLSRILENNSIKFDAAIDQKYLENIPTQCIDNVTISPELIHKICMSPLSPEFSAIAPRRKQAFERVLTEDKMLELIKGSRLPEEDLLNAICYGRESVRPNSVIFTDKTNKNIISQGEFNNLSRKMNFPAIKAQILFMAQHYSHSEIPEEMQRLCQEFLTNLRNYLESNANLRILNITTSVKKLIAQPDVSESEFFDLLQEFQRSPAYNTESDFNELSPCLFIPTFLKEKSEIYLEFNEGALQIRAKEEKFISVGDPGIYSVYLDFVTKFYFSVENKTSELFYPVMKEMGLTKTINYIVVGCNNESLTIKKNQLLCKLIFHFGEGDCNCVNPQRVHYVLEREGPSDQEREVQILLSELMCQDINTPDVCVLCYSKNLRHCVCRAADIMLSHTTSDKQSEKPLINSNLQQPDPLPGDIAPRNVRHDKISHLNQLITACLSFNRKNIFAPNYVKSLQGSSEFLTKIRKLIKDGKTDKYFLFKDCIFYKEKDRDILCLDDSTTKLLFDSLHQKGFHHSENLLLDHYKKYFRNKNEKKLSKESINGCPICVFGRPCRKTNFVLNYSDETMKLPFESLWADLAENVFRSDNGFCNFIICVDQSTNRVFGSALKSTKGEEVCNFFMSLISFLGIFKTLHSDMGSAFGSNVFQTFLQRYKISHVRSCSRSCSNGTSEQKVKQVRDKLKDIILTDTIEKRKKWDLYFTDALNLINSSSPFSKINHFSRDQLFFGPNRFISNIAFNFEGSLPMTDSQHQETLARLHQFRLEYRKNYDHKINPFILGQLVIFIKSKEDLQDSDGRGKHLQATCSTIYKVIGLNDNSCRLLDLITAAEISIDFGRLRGLTLTEIKTLFENSTFGVHSSFKDNSYKRGYGRTCLETVHDLINRVDDYTDAELGERGNNEPSPSPSPNITNQNLDIQTNEQPLHQTNESLDRTNESPEQKLRQIAHHPYPPSLISRWQAEDKLIPRRSDRNMRYPIRERKANKKFQVNCLSVSFNENVRERVFSMNEFVDSIKPDNIPFLTTKPKIRAVSCERDMSRREVVMLTGLEQ